jgi:hypothetical protein
MLHIDCQPLRRRSEAADRGYRFGQRSRPDVYALWSNTKLLVSTPAALSDHANCMSFIDQEEAFKLFLHGNQVREWTDTTVHRKTPSAMISVRLGRVPPRKLRAQRSRIIVPESVYLHTCHLPGVQQAAMTESIEDHSIGGTK